MHTYESNYLICSSTAEHISFLYTSGSMKEHEHLCGFRVFQLPPVMTAIKVCENSVLISQWPKSSFLRSSLEKIRQGITF